MKIRDNDLRPRLASATTAVINAMTFLRLKLSATWPAGNVKKIIGVTCVRPTRARLINEWVRSKSEFPADGGREHLLPDGGNQLASQVKTEVTIAQNCVGAIDLQFTFTNRFS